MLAFYGGVGEVTGSRHLLTVGTTKILMDCGLFQGHRQEAIAKNRTFPFDPKNISAVVLSHAHIDHSGSLPLLVKSGFRGPIYVTPPTRDLAIILLLDSARLQEDDAAFFNKLHAADGQRIEPIYTADDVEQAVSQMVTVDFGQDISVGPVTARLSNAGHVLGSAMVELRWADRGRPRTVFYTGDLGRKGSLFLRPPEPPETADLLLIESTYGNRLHAPVVDAESPFARVIERAVQTRGKVLIPSFALERSQEIVFLLQKIYARQKMDGIPVYVDSPMASRITSVFNKYLDHFSFSEEFRRYVKTDREPFGFDAVHFLTSREESKELNERDGPMIIISASGMCEGGRILHHLRHSIGDPRTSILLVGYQAQGTLGRRLQDGQRKVRIFGLEHAVAANVLTMSFFSSHGDRDDLTHFVRGIRQPPEHIFLVHGDQADRAALQARWQAEMQSTVHVPGFGDRFPLN